MGRHSSDPVTQDLAREICVRTGSKALLSGSVASFGSHYMVGLHATNCQSGDSLGSAEMEAGSREQVLRALSDATLQVRSKLGDSLASIARPDRPLAGMGDYDVTTSSIEALQALSQAYIVFRERGDAAAVPLLRRAIELDPNFARAYVQLGVRYNNLSQNGLAVENLKKAYELRDRVSEREKLFITAIYYAEVTGEVQKSNEVYEVWAQAYPRDPHPHIDLGSNFLILGRFEASASESKKALQLDGGTPNGMSNLISAFLALGQLDGAAATVAQSAAHKIDAPNIHQQSYLLAFLQADEPTMQREIAAVVDRPGGEDVLLSTASDTQAYYGRLAKAREWSMRAEESARNAGFKESAATWRVNAALREAELGNFDLARQYVASALTPASGHPLQAMAALALARSGDLKQSQRLVDKLQTEMALDTMWNGYWLPSIRAARELNQNRPDAAITALQAAQPFEIGQPPPFQVGPMYPAFLRGEAYRMSGHGKEAAAEFQKLIDHRGVVLNFVLGAKARLGLARSYTLSGDPTKAKAAYQEFLSLWKDADPDIPILKQARAEYAKLQ